MANVAINGVSKSDVLRCSDSVANIGPTASSLSSLATVTSAELRKGTPRLRQFSHTFLKEHGLYPYDADGRRKLAVASFDEQEILSALILSMGGQVELQLASPEDIEIALDDAAAHDEAQTELWSDTSVEATGDDVDSLRDLASGAPVVKALEDILERSVAMRSTDIHIAPRGKEALIRVRIDGVMRTLPAPRDIAARAIVSRIKILAALNIAERRLPQDGHFRTTIRRREFDIRVATMPTLAGEAAVLRLLDRNGTLVDFDRLGFSERDGAVLEQILAQPHGMLVVTGPTGSGKTTTLAASLSRLNDGSRTY